MSTEKLAPSHYFINKLYPSKVGNELLKEQILSLQTQIEQIEQTYAYSGQSPLNEPGVVAPPDPQTLRLHQDLSCQLYQLQLQAFIEHIRQNLNGPNNSNDRDKAIETLFNFTHHLERYQPQKVRDDFGDENYVNWLEITTTALMKFNVADPKLTPIISVLQKHLDVTSEFAELNQKLSKVLSQALLSLNEA